MATVQQSPETNRMFISQNGVVSLEIEEDLDIDVATRLFVKTSNDLKLEIKYPNLDRLDSSFFDGERSSYLKTTFISTFSSIDQHDSGIKKASKNLCESVIGLYPNLAYDPIRKCYKVIVQGFVPNKPLFKQNQIKIGDLIVSINNVEITSDNLEEVLSRMVHSQQIKITALSPITYINLNTDEQILRTIVGATDNSSQKPKVVVASKSTSVVKGDRVRYSDQMSHLVDEAFIYAMILSLEQQKLRQNTSPSDKNDVIYTFPRNDMEVRMKKTPTSEFMFGLFETVRGLLVTLSYAVKDINQQDEAVCSTIQYKDELYYVSFLHENFGKQGVLVMITPSRMLDLNYYKLVSRNLNHTLRFTFGASISRAIRRRALELIDNDTNASSGHYSVDGGGEDALKLRAHLDEFFVKFNRRLLESTYFELFNNALDDAKQNLMSTPRALTFLHRVNVFREMRAKFLDSLPYHDLPFNIKTDLDSALVNLEAQEMFADNDDVDLDKRASLKTRRLFNVKGCCLFFKDYLIATHLNKSITKSVYEFCAHFDLFTLTRNGNTNVFHIWREVHIITQPNGYAPKTMRHFMIIVIMREFLLSVILESGGAITREFDPNKKIDPDPLFIQQATHVLSDMHDSGLMLDIQRHFSPLSSSPIMFNVNRFASVFKSQPVKSLVRVKKSNSRSPIRIGVGEQQPRSRGIDRSASADSKRAASLTNSNQAYSNRPISQSRDSHTAAAAISNGGFSNNNNNDDESSEYFSRKTSRYDSYGALTEFSKKFLNLEATMRFFPDLVLNDALIYFATTEGHTNGVLFSQRVYDLNSNLFTRIFYNFVKSCFKIRNLFERANKLQTSEMFRVSETSHFDLIEHGVLFSLFIDPDLQLENNNNNKKASAAKVIVEKPPRVIDKSKLREMSFWVVGRRKLRRVDSKSEWKSHGDLFICFNDSLDHVLVELAFDVGFSKLAM